jgi:hypothetical protein
MAANAPPRLEVRPVSKSWTPGHEGVGTPTDRHSHNITNNTDATYHHPPKSPSYEVYAGGNVAKQNHYQKFGDALQSAAGDSDIAEELGAQSAVYLNDTYGPGGPKAVPGWVNLNINDVYDMLFQNPAVTTINKPTFAQGGWNVACLILSRVAMIQDGRPDPSTPGATYFGIMCGCG